MISRKIRINLIELWNDYFLIKKYFYFNIIINCFTNNIIFFILLFNFGIELLIILYYL